MKSQMRLWLLCGLFLAVILAPTTAMLRAAGTNRPMQSHSFTDVPTPGKEFMEPYIDTFYHQGITSGCGISPMRFCPEDPVTRGSMAVFIGRALGYVEAQQAGYDARAYFKTISGIGAMGISQNGAGLFGSSDSSFGVRGSSDDNYGVYGQSFFGPAAVYGQGGGTISIGVHGHSKHNYGVYAESDNASGLYVEAGGDVDVNEDTIYDIQLGGTRGEIIGTILNLYANEDFFINLDRNNNSSQNSFMIRNGNNIVTFRVNEQGDITADGSLFMGGSKSSIVDTVSHGTRAMYAIEGTEVWFEDAGSAQLVNGEVTIEFDSIFAETVNLNEDYQVFLTPVGGWAELYIVEKTSTSITVRATDATSDLRFDYRVLAKRLGYEDVRMEEVGD